MATQTTLRVDGVSKVGDTFQAIVSVEGTSPSGNVVLKDKTVTLSTVSLVNGVATFTISGLAYGSHPLWASYEGSEPSISPTVLHTVHRSEMNDSLIRRLPRVVTFEQETAASTWTVTHNFGGYPAIDVYIMYEGALNKIIPRGITYVNENVVEVNFSSAYAGFATVV